MEPDYHRMDPEEGLNKFLALLSFIIGLLSLCAGLIPLCGFISAGLGIILGYFGRRSERRKLATAGMILSAFGLLVAIIYSLLLFFQKNKP